MITFPYKHIVVVGTTSSGKSTLAERLATKLNSKFIDLDALHWEPNWQEAPDGLFRERVRFATQAPAWVVAGNYHATRDLIWPHAEVIIWLDYSLPRIFWQLTRRTFSRWWRRELLWGTNYENLATHFKLWSQESLYHWLFKTYWRRKREIPLLLTQHEHRHLKLMHFHSPQETNQWFNQLLKIGDALNIYYTKLTEPTPEIAAAFTKWENDPALIYLTRPNANESALERRETVTVEDLTNRIKDHHLYLIYLDDQLIGEMSYQVDPPHLYKKETGTAWIGITIGEEVGRGKGIGYQALQYLEEEIKAQGLKRIELGVFEFNTNAIKLYQTLGYKEIARINNFTYWQGKMWQDIRMEKYLSIDKT